MPDEESAAEVKQILEIIEQIGHKLNFLPSVELGLVRQVFQVLLPVVVSSKEATFLEVISFSTHLIKFL
jgi:hypothetical protein